MHSGRGPPGLSLEDPSHARILGCMATLKPSEYGGADTKNNLGVQPSPHVPTAAEQLRIMYAQDPAEVQDGS